jgi:hypothetical protein
MTRSTHLAQPPQQPKNNGDTSFELHQRCEEHDPALHQHVPIETPSKHNKKPTFREKLHTFPWKPSLAILSLPLALALIVGLATTAERASLNYILPRDCYPNGLWKEAAGATWRIMDSSYFFTPNLSFGSMTCTQGPGTM